MPQKMPAGRHETLVLCTIWSTTWRLNRTRFEKHACPTRDEIAHLNQHGVSKLVFCTNDECKLFLGPRAVFPRVPPGDGPCLLPSPFDDEVRVLFERRSEQEDM